MREIASEKKFKNSVCVVVCWNLMNPQGKEWNLLYLQNMKATLQAKDLLRCRITIWCTSSSRCHKRWEYQMQRPQWIKNGKKLETIPAWSLGKKSIAKWSRLFHCHLGARLVLCTCEIVGLTPHFRDDRCPLCHIDGHLSSRKCGVRPTISQVHRTSHAPRWQCKRRLWSLCRLYWTGLICVSNDCCRNNGCCCKITRLCWTSSWRHISIHSSKDGEWSKIAQTSQIGMSRCLDTCSTTQMAKIMGKHRRSSGSSWTKFIRTSTCWSLVEKTVRGSLGMSVCHRKQGLFLSGIRGWYQNGWREAEYGTHVEETDGECWFWRTNFISRPRFFGMHSTWMPNEIMIDEYRKNVRITNFCWSNWKNTCVGITSRKDGRVVLRHGRSCSNMLWYICCELANKKTEQLYKVSSPCLDDHHVKTEQLQSNGELSKICSQIVLKCFSSWHELSPNGQKLVTDV